MFVYERGIRLNGSNVWVDVGRKVETCIVSHGHMDHAKKHQLILATEKTIAILKNRIGLNDAHVLRYGEPFHLDGFSVTLYPAGHILGSAQVLIEMNGRRLLYSGDFNIAGSATAEPIEIPESDILIMECTFGKPHYRFPHRQQIEQQLVTFVERTFAAGKVPVVVGYALGKSQEAMKIIGAAGYAMAVHSAAAKMARIYEQYGIVFGDWQSLNKDDLHDKVLIVAHHVTKTRFLARMQNKRTLFLSGWAVDSGFRFRVRTDEALPLSDHADFPGLMRYAKQVNARQIFTTHGFDEFAYHLRQEGYDAQPLKKQAQLELF